MSKRATQSMGFSEPDRIVVRGLDVCSELIGVVDFGSMVFLEIVGRLPTEAEARMTNAVLVAITEHGITANALATRLTYLASPSAIQGAVAAGVLGAGEVFLGALEGCARLIQELHAEGASEQAIRARLESMKDQRQVVPGIGHPLHKPVDPRTVRLYQLADELGIAGDHRSLLDNVREIAEDVFGRSPLPVNADGAIAAVLSDMGFPWGTTRGFAIVSRAAGLVGHVWDEAQNPTAKRIWSMAEEALEYRDPDPLF